MAAIRRKEEVPTSLPSGRLYLEDIQEIVELFVSAVKHGDDYERFIGSDKLDADTSVLFDLGEYTCDSVGELECLGEKTSDLGITVNRRLGGAIALMMRDWGTSWVPMWLSKATLWSVYWRLKKIFERRPLKERTSEVILRYEHPGRESVNVVVQQPQEPWHRKLFWIIIASIIAIILTAIVAWLRG